MSRMKRIRESVQRTYDEEGAYWVAEKGFNTIRRKAEKVVHDSTTSSRMKKKYDEDFFVDVLFVNGCDYSLPHPIRYRVDHQIEQLEAAGFSCFRIDAWNIRKKYARNARVFIFYRCPYSDEIDGFIKEAKSLNKRVLFDIDDLVIDTAYTDDIPFIQGMSSDEKRVYDEGVNRMRKTMLLCDGVITTTEGMADELKKVMPKVFINRNTASDTMLMLSEEAIYRRDVLPYLDVGETPSHMSKIQLQWRERADCNEILIGYFSGSITHNDDFVQMIPVLKEIFGLYPNVKLMVVGELDVPCELDEYSDRIVSIPFCKWTKLPGYIARCDINIVPLRDTVFNRAKSENKWVEASLVKVPTVASNIGPFEKYIEDGVTGKLCETGEDWFDALRLLIEDSSLRKSIADNAFEYCKYNCVTIYNTLNIRRIIEGELTKNIAFVMPSLDVSGGVLVALKHGSILRKAGYDVSYISINDDDEWVDYCDERFPVLDRVAKYGQMKNCPFRGRFDKLVATLWDTLDFVRRYPNVVEKMYLVQGFEIDFNLPDSPLRLSTAQTYQNIQDVTYLTISKWCKNWLKDRYGVDARYAPNGLDVEKFFEVERNFDERPIRVLVEGDCQMKEKNIDEAFDITNELDPDRFEVWYMNYTGKSKPRYRIDNNLGAIDADKVPDVYRSCHILLKTSKNESFSFPPLEMMATGGYVVVLPNSGNAEYIENGGNCLTYEPGNVNDALDAIHRLVEERDLRKRLRLGGLETAAARGWDSVEEDVLRLYDPS